MLNSSELQIGDLIYFLESKGVPEHVAVYASNKNGEAYVIHATTGSYNSVMLNRLNPPDHGCAYHVVRPVNRNLAGVAVGILLRWVEHQVRFATTEKRELVLNRLDSMGGLLDNEDFRRIGPIQEAHGKETYRSKYEQYFEMIHALPLIPEEDGLIKGLFCSEAIVSAFNIALLVMHETCSRTLAGYVWSPDPILSLDIFIELLDNPLPFDAKQTLPAGMLKHCLDSPGQWTDLGMLAIQPPECNATESAFNKENWLEFRRSLRIEAPEKIRQLMPSPGSSPRHSSGGSPGGSSQVGCESSLVKLLTLSNAPVELEPRASSPLHFLGLMPIKPTAATQYHNVNTP